MVPAQRKGPQTGAEGYGEGSGGFHRLAPAAVVSCGRRIRHGFDP